MDRNPYAAPTSDGGPLSTELVFSEEGVLVANSLAVWMRVLGVFYGVMAALCGVATLFSIVTFFPIGLAFALVTALVWIAGAWLRESGTAFSHGVAGDDEMAIGSGFGKLRNFLVLFGVLAILQLLQTVLATLGQVL